VRHDGRALQIAFADGTALETDFLILGTGFTVDPLSRREFGAAAEDILLWRDVYTPPPGEESRDLGLFPYLNPDFTFREKTPGRAPWLRHVFCFNYGSTVSLGKTSGDIPAVSIGGEWLGREMARTLYLEDIDHHWQALQDYATPELLAMNGGRPRSGPRRWSMRVEEGTHRMTNSTDTAVTAAVGLRPGSRVAVEVANRSEIFAKTQAAEDAVLAPADPGGLSHDLRHALAARIAALHAEPDQAARYAAGVADAAIAALAQPGTAAADTRVQAMLAFTDAVSTNPRDMVADDVRALQAAGASDADIVRLAELNAFLSYQLRVIAGLRLLVGAAE
jgi:uncharacterized protein YciW